MKLAMHYNHRQEVHMLGKQLIYIAALRNSCSKEFSSPLSDSMVCS